ncbi:isoprenylcysteine carboxylmethyltransferase family protein [Sphingomonas sp. BIUV-7]|uniref:methanethiol S-methyltransferase n=1 Tax=Sphingomonas natans TaxID=3063330 RepID=A0ABT8Y4D6_9SPHN|nr:methanethiol S-methyltransferase [Sphingomonas sp. BIUV-7]MDO6413185.1 isoprenylcysteine carboxylmethyltransferase family protein [Sphingomonas sp. BIUV-7]
MSRVAHLLFGIVAYGVFLGVFLYLIGFVGDLAVLPRTVDHPASALAPVAAIAVDALLILVFGLQHSIMARAGFKAAWTRIVPEAIERSLFVLFASAALVLLFLFWQPLRGDVWDVRGTLGAPLLWVVFGAGWGIVLLSTFLINHFELFGLSQVWNQLRQRPAAAPVLRQPLLYKLVRHPLYSGFFIAFWATPHMSYGHALLAVGMSVYMLIAIVYEERDLVRMFGQDYEEYRGRVGKLAPRLRRAR